MFFLLQERKHKATLVQLPTRNILPVCWSAVYAKGPFACRVCIHGRELWTQCSFFKKWWNANNNGVGNWVLI